MPRAQFAACPMARVTTVAIRPADSLQGAEAIACVLACTGPGSNGPGISVSWGITQGSGGRDAAC
eukprot:5579559-Alexandrium_andersonii.AAC.1